MDGYMGEIRLFSGNFPPRGWAFCNGALLDIADNTALFSLLGCTFGGDCRSVFGLPDTRGRVVIGRGQGPGIPYDFDMGDYGGAEKVIISQSQLPAHIHSLQKDISGEVTPLAVSDIGTSDDPQGNIFAATSTGVKTYAATADNVMADNAVSVHANIAAGNTGDDQAHDNIMPVTALNYIICTEGQYPMRS